MIRRFTYGYGMTLPQKVGGKWECIKFRANLGFEVTVFGNDYEWDGQLELDPCRLLPLLVNWLWGKIKAIELPFLLEAGVERGSGIDDLGAAAKKIVDDAGDVVGNAFKDAYNYVKECIGSVVNEVYVCGTEWVSCGWENVNCRMEQFGCVWKDVNCHWENFNCYMEQYGCWVENYDCVWQDSFNWAKINLCKAGCTKNKCRNKCKDKHKSSSQSCKQRNRCHERQKCEQRQKCDKKEKKCEQDKKCNRDKMTC